MLGKLMKHEFKATSRLLVPLYIALLFLSVINYFLFNYGGKEGIFVLITGFLFVAQTLFTMAIVTGTVIFMVIRFYKNFLSDEGYLMFTLPVSSHQLIFSKLIVTLFWVLVSVIAAMVSWFVTIGSLNDINLITFITGINTNISSQFNATFGFSWILLFTELVILGVLFLVGNILLVYSSIAIGQLFKKYKIVASFVSYVAITTVLQFLGVAGMIGLGYVLPNNFNSLGMFPTVVLPIFIITAIIGCAIFYTATNYIFSRKLNLE